MFVCYVWWVHLLQAVKTDGNVPDTTGCGFAELLIPRVQAEICVFQMGCPNAGFPGQLGVNDGCAIEMGSCTPHKMKVRSLLLPGVQDPSNQCLLHESCYWVDHFSKYD
jgi:hypothetical protein